MSARSKWSRPLCDNGAQLVVDIVLCSVQMEEFPPNVAPLRTEFDVF